MALCNVWIGLFTNKPKENRNCESLCLLWQIMSNLCPWHCFSKRSITRMKTSWSPWAVKLLKRTTNVVNMIHALYFKSYYSFVWDWNLCLIVNPIVPCTKLFWRLRIKRASQIDSFSYTYSMLIFLSDLELDNLWSVYCNTYGVWKRTV